LCAQINNKHNIIIIIIIIIITAASIRRAEGYQTARCHVAVGGNQMTTLRNQTVTPYVDGIPKKETTWLSRLVKLVVKTPNDGGLSLPTAIVKNRKGCGRDTEGTMNTELQCCFLHWRQGAVNSS
jgi:hypothetical protein